MIRPARPGDAAAVVELVRELARYERAEHEVELTAPALAHALFGDTPAVFCDVAEQDEEIVGFALWFVTYSTWLGRHGIYLEDLFVRPEHRRAGHGRALLRNLAQRAVERGYGRLEWAVLDWNEPAIAFYRSVGAVPMDEWTVNRVSGDPLRRLAAAPPPAPR